MLGTCRFVAVIIQACVVYCLVYSTMAGKILVDFEVESSSCVYHG